MFPTPRFFLLRPQARFIKLSKEQTCASFWGRDSLRNSQRVPQITGPRGQLIRNDLVDSNNKVPSFSLFDFRSSRGLSYIWVYLWFPKIEPHDATLSKEPQILSECALLGLAFYKAHLGRPWVHSSGGGFGKSALLTFSGDKSLGLGGCPVHCRVPCSVPGLCPLATLPSPVANSNLSPSCCDNQKCPQTLSEVPWGQKSPSDDHFCSRESSGIKKTHSYYSREHSLSGDEY